LKTAVQNMSPESPVSLLFSYGTLQKKDIQLATFGRQLNGREDAIRGFALRTVPVVDPKIRALTGESTHFDLEADPDPKAAVPGTVFEITAEELRAADRYEEAAGYKRISVPLRSGSQSWVYVREK
jgi:gamma-glutamylcyclotransferase (GGCT)/AIG2-like uncharacterized protein YtfP